MDLNKTEDPELRILFVEDNKHDRAAFRRAFKDSRIPCDITEFERAEDALERLQPDESSFDIVITDQGLLGMSGLEFCKELLARKTKLPLVILTGKGTEQIASDALKSGIYDYIIKDNYDGYLKLLPITIAGVVNKHNEKQLRIKAEEQNKEWKNRYEAAIKASRHMLYDWNSETNEITYGGDLKGVLGYYMEEMKGGLTRWIELVHPDDQDYFNKTIEHLITTKEPSHLEYRVRRKDGNYIFVDDSGQFFTDSKGNISRMIGFVKDITAHKREGEEIVKMQKLESVGILAGGIAHDFNNNLQGILSLITLAKTYANPKDEIYGRLAEAEKAVLQSRNLTQQLLTFSKGGDPVKKTISVSELIMNSAKLALSGSNVKCEFGVSEDSLWQVEADKGQISQAINNIIINADQTMPEGGNIKVWAENTNVVKKDSLPLKEGRYVKIVIKDHGTGISQEHMQKIFDPYFTTKQKGSGLGLAITYSIIKKHGGHITVESEMGVGTTFHIYLPASRKEALEKPVPNKVREKDVEEVPITGRGKVLLMEDDDLIRDSTGEHLRRLRYEVETAEGGSEAIELYKGVMKSGKPFDVVVLDLTIPGGMGGKEAIKKFLEIDPDVKAIVASGYSNDPVMSDFRKHGFSGVIDKPYEIHELNETLQKVIMEKS